MTRSVAHGPHAFLSCSSRPEDKEVRVFFGNLLAAYGINVICEDLEVPTSSLAKAIEAKIRQCPIFFGVVTKRKHPVAGTKAPLSPTWVTAELGMHKALEYVSKLKYISIIALETGVPESETFRGLATSYFEFERGKLGEAIANLHPHMKSALDALAQNPLSYKTSTITQWQKSIPPRPSEISFIPFLEKSVLIMPSGHGIVDCLMAVQTGDRGLERLRHEITLNENVPSNLRLPSIKRMFQHHDNPFSQPTFCCRLLPGSPPDVLLHPEEVGTRRGSRKRIFDLVLSKRLPAHEVVRYSWGWSFPKLYVVKGRDRTSYKAAYPVEAFNLSMKFYFGKPAFQWNFTQDPLLSVSSLHGTQRMSIPGTPVISLRFVEFRWNNIALSPGEQAVAVYETAPRNVATSSAA